jgi:hypothetical protein
MDVLKEKVRLANDRGYGVIYFYWEGLWGKYSVPEGPQYRKKVFKQMGVNNN